MTTDPEEGRRQAETMQPEPIKVGDRVRLSAGGERVMIVVAMEDYGNKVVCEWKGEDQIVYDDRFPVRSLVRVEAEAAEKAG